MHAALALLCNTPVWVKQIASPRNPLIILLRWMRLAMTMRICGESPPRRHCERQNEICIIRVMWP